MTEKKIKELLDNKNTFTIPKYLLNVVKTFELNLSDFILLIYLINQKNEIIFDYNKIKEETNLDDDSLADSITNLKSKKILTINVKKNEFNLIEEKIDISSFYDIIFSKIINDEKKETKNSSIYKNFEDEFGRTLSPIEYEIINSWLEQNIDEKLIIEALKEAVYNGVNNLRYVDKILFEWNKKGIKTKDDIKKNNIKLEETIKQNEDSYDYDWLND